MLGEGQILSQVKEAYALAREASATSTVLNTLMHRAIKTGKRVRAETRIQYNSVSVSYAAVELASEKLGGLEGRHALIFGAGKMAELTAQHLVAHGISLIYVANRHMERAAELAARFGGEAIPFEGALLDADVIVTSTGAPHYVVKAWETQQFMTKRRGRPVFFIDIAVPRDVDPEVSEIRGVTLYNIDALEAVVDEHRAERREEAKAADAIIEEEVASLEDRFRYLSLRPHRRARQGALAPYRPHDADDRAQDPAHAHDQAEKIRGHGVRAVLHRRDARALQARYVRGNGNK